MIPISTLVTVSMTSIRPPSGLRVRSLMLLLVETTYDPRHLGIEPAIWDAFEGIMAGGDVRIVMAGNPTRPSGPFFDAFHDQRSLWNCITIDAFDSPNLVGLDLEQLLQLDPRDGGPLDDKPRPRQNGATPPE